MRVRSAAVPFRPYRPFSSDSPNSEPIITKIGECKMINHLQEQTLRAESLRDQLHGTQTVSTPRRVVVFDIEKF